MLFMTPRPVLWNVRKTNLLPEMTFTEQAIASDSATVCSVPIVTKKTLTRREIMVRLALGREAADDPTPVAADGDVAQQVEWHLR
jgi:hypothetical protein